MRIKNRLYLDSNATAPLHPKVAEVLSRHLQDKTALFNPSSTHSFGRQAQTEIRHAKQTIAQSLNTHEDQLLFTSSGSEANQLAIRSALNAFSSHPEWVLTKVDHSSVLNLESWAQSQGVKVKTWTVDPAGRPEPEALVEAVSPQTSLVSLLWVNNETGVITDVEALVPKIRKLSHGRALIHIDAAQAWGKIPLSLEKIDADFITFSGHKIGALSGTGVLWFKDPKTVTPLILGAQEKGRRGGTENVLGIISLGIAAAHLSPEKYQSRTSAIRDSLEGKILKSIPTARVNGRQALRVGNTSSITFEGVKAEELIIALDLEGFAVSAGSACASGALKPSHVLMTLGLSEKQAKSSLRISFSDRFSDEEIAALDQFPEVLSQVVDKFLLM